MGSPMTDERDPDAKARRRDQILRVATAVFADKGYHKASISHIIERAGIARGTFY
ncbi:MAG: TetR/AcrR family transcriptional regulator, partial [Deltaproteobacteria bacterium]|nr:TetR/AcrR family transcriptional regulator [Deltaproteobacteria bacterium]